MNGMSRQSPSFYGKDRGGLTNNKDPNGLGRVRVKVRDVLGDEESGWAMPSAPYAGKDVGLYLIPPEKAFVWVEFEHGDPDYPIWCGCFWAEGEAPAQASRNEGMHEKKVLKTDVGTITLNDSSSDGGITIEMNKDPKLKITLDKNGIVITTGKGATVKLKDNKVSINDDALEVQ